MDKKNIYRVVTRDSDGRIVTQDFNSIEEIGRSYQQIGVDNCSTRKELRSLPIFRGLIGPMKEGAHVIRYEEPNVFEELTREWFDAVPVRRIRNTAL